MENGIKMFWENFQYISFKRMYILNVKLSKHERIREPIVKLTKVRKRKCIEIIQ